MASSICLQVAGITDAATVLTYESAQEHDPRVSRLANDPMALYAAMHGSIDDAGGDTLGSVHNLLIALKAAHLREKRSRR